MSYNKIPYRATVQFSVFKLNLQTCIKVNIKIIDSIHPQTNIIKAFFLFFQNVLWGNSFPVQLHVLDMLWLGKML